MSPGKRVAKNGFLELRMLISVDKMANDTRIPQNGLCRVENRFVSDD